MKKLAEKVKELAKKNSIAISKMLSDCNITKSFIYDISEREATPSVDKVIQIADYFNVSVDYLLGRETPSNGLSDEERELLDLYKKLNATGKQKLLEYAEDLTGNKKYVEEYADEFEKRAAN